MISMARILGAPAEGSGGEAGLEGVDGGEVLLELAFDGADQVHDVAVAFHEHQVFDADGAVLADAANVVAAQVDEHDVLGDFFLVGAEVGFEGAIFGLVGGARGGCRRWGGTRRRGRGRGRGVRARSLRCGRGRRSSSLGSLADFCRV